jgi:hypothetical protein
MSDQLRQFVFRGILARHAANDMQNAGILHRAYSRAAERDDVDLFASVQSSIRDGSIQMQRAYRILYVLENVVRDLIASRFLEPDGPTWFEKRSSSAMKAKVAQRKEQEAKNQWHSGRNKDDIFHLDFGDLAKLITTHWILFEDLLPSQAWVQARLDEAERSRNVIAHTNLLSGEEVARLELYLRDWMRQTG